MPAPLDGIPEMILMGKFVDGMNEDLKAGSRVWRWRAGLWNVLGNVDPKGPM